MGEEIPPEPPDRDYGIDCLDCYDAGKTPLVIYAYFSGVLLCPGKSWPGGVDLNRDWTLTRFAYPTFPCSWRYLDANWNILYTAHNATFCLLWAKNAINELYFREVVYGTFCLKLFNSDLSCGGAEVAHEGTGAIV